MGLRVDCKTKEGAYEEIREKLSEKGYNISPPEEIDWGIQFKVSKGQLSEIVRIYQSKKKGVTLDPSQLRDKQAKKDILLVFGYADGAEDEDLNEVEGDFYSLCIGIDKFDSKLFLDLEYAKKDAKDINDLIKSKFETDNSKNIFLSDKEATKENILNSLRSIEQQAQDEDTIMIFIATHGDVIKLENTFEYYIINSQVDDNDISKNSVPMRELREIVSNMKPDKKIIFLDTCHSGGISRRDRRRIPEHAVESLFKDAASENFVMISSSQPDQSSIECKNLQQGVFTHFLKRGLTGNVESSNGRVDLYTLYSFLFKSVNEYTKTYYKTEQKPKFFGSLTGPLNLPLLKSITSLLTGKIHTFEKINCVGIDESGKGDFFGPLVVAGVYVDTEEKISLLKEAGIKDSKKLSDRKIKVIAQRIRQICDSEVVEISPQRYNEMWSSMASLNEVLAWSHAQSLERLLERNSSCDLAISDQFAGKEILVNKLKSKGKKIELIQRPKAEENMAVAAASILARERFLSSLSLLGKRFSKNLSKGSNPQVEREALELISKGKDLRSIAKIHFKTYEKVLADFNCQKTIVK